MSFRRRSDIIGGSKASSNLPGIRRNPRDGSIDISSRRAGKPLVCDGKPPSQVRFNRYPASISASTVPKGKVGTFVQHPGIRPSIVTSLPCTSTGSEDIDRILEHNGIPLGNSFLVEEDGATDFGISLLRLFLAQGVVYSRLQQRSLSRQSRTHQIVIGVPQQWISNLPGLYNGSSRQKKQEELEKKRKQVSVTNVLEENHVSQMKIAWRYGIQQQKMQSIASASSRISPEFNSSRQYPNYCSQFDITSTLVPAANPTEVTCIPFTQNINYDDILFQIDSVISHKKDALVRIAIPSFLNPLLYSEELTQSRNVIAFLYGMKRIMHKYRNRVVLMATLGLDLYSRGNSFVTILESNFMDAVIELKPFDPDLRSYLERVYRKQPMKVKHGHLNIYKIPQLSDLGLMKMSELELCFKNGRKRFDVEQWSIPIDEEETKERKQVDGQGQNEKVHVKSNFNYSSPSMEF